VPTHRLTVPQVQMGLRPMASRIPAAEARIKAERIQARRDMGKA